MIRLLLALALSGCGEDAPLPEPEEVSVPRACTAVRLTGDGLLAVSTPDGEVVGRLAGATLRDGAEQEVATLLGRLDRVEDLTCEVDASAEPPLLTITFVAWRDKSGAVHEDLATLLVTRGLAVRR